MKADNYFTVIPEWVLFHPNLSADAVRLYGALRRYADRTDMAWPTKRTLAARLGVSQRTLRRHMAELEEIEAVDTSPRWRDDGTRSSNAYHLRSAMPDLSGGGDSAEGGDGDTPDTPLIQSHLEPEPFSKRQDIGVAIYEEWTRTKWVEGNHLTPDEIDQIDTTIAALPSQVRTRTVHRRAEEWRRRYPDATFTPKAMRTHWASLAIPEPGCQHSWQMAETEKGYRYTCGLCDATQDLKVTPTF